MLYLSSAFSAHTFPTGASVGKRLIVFRRAFACGCTTARQHGPGVMRNESAILHLTKVDHVRPLTVQRGDEHMLLRQVSRLRVSMARFVNAVDRHSDRDGVQ
jgi:hypothetical protein